MNYASESYGVFSTLTMSKSTTIVWSKTYEELNKTLKTFGEKNPKFILFCIVFIKELYKTYLTSFFSNGHATMPNLFR